MKKFNNFSEEDLTCAEDELFVDDYIFAPASVTWVKKKLSKMNPTDKPIICDRCKKYYARHIDQCHPFYDDFTLCEKCLNEL